MFNYKNRGISTLVAIGIIAVLVVVVGGGVFGYQYFSSQKNNNQQNSQDQQQTPNNQTNNIQPSITVLSPNGGETWTAGSIYDITWTSTKLDSNTNVNIAFISGGTSVPIATVLNSGVYSWTLPFGNGATGLKISITSALNTSVSDTSDGTFTVAGNKQTAGWKTYTSNDLKYSFKYPSDWRIIPNYSYSAAGFGGLVGYTITTSNSKIPPDNERIDIGGAQVDCASLSNLNRQEHPAGVLCKTNYPVYTFSTDPNVISVFNIIASSISDIKTATDQTVGWKTYINAQYGYEIKYPNNWSPWITQPDSFSLNADWSKQISELAILQSHTGFIGTTIPYCEFHLVSYSNPQNLSINDFWKNLFGSYETSKSVSNIMFGNNQVSGKVFVMERKDQPLPNEQTAVITEHNNNFIVLLWWGQNPATSNPDCASADQIISTFKFTK